jgi:hypothetical protein
MSKFFIPVVRIGSSRSHCDAEGHLQALRRLIPDAQLVIMFDLDLNKRCRLEAGRNLT